MFLLFLCVLGHLCVVKNSFVVKATMTQSLSIFNLKNGRLQGGGDMAYFQKIQNDRLLTKSELTDYFTETFSAKRLFNVSPIISSPQATAESSEPPTQWRQRGKKTKKPTIMEPSKPGQVGHAFIWIINHFWMTKKVRIFILNSPVNIVDHYLEKKIHGCTKYMESVFKRRGAVQGNMARYICIHL